jgi:DNA-binding response OmpR family regulator
MDPKKCVLIVDDEPTVRLVLQTALESVGYDVIEAADGRAALDHLRAGTASVDLVLLDLQMPKMNGMELLEQLRAAGITVPVVILTAHGSIPEAVSAMKLGAIDFLTKPITPEALRRVVAEVIDRHAIDPEPLPIAVAMPVPADRSRRRVAFDLARAKRALNNGRFSEAETVLREISAIEPAPGESAVLLERLLELKQQETQGSFRILRDWFPSGKTQRNS